MIKKIFAYVSVMLAVLIFCPGPGSGQEEAPAVDPMADEILRQMSEYMNSLERFTFHAENTDEEVLSNLQKLQYGSTVEMSVRRPDRFRADVSGDYRNQQLFYDGKTITLYGKEVNYYASIDAPDTIEEALDHALVSFDLYSPMGDFIDKNSYTYAKENLVSGFYVGLSSVNGVECHHLAFRQVDVDWQIWVENSKTPLPRKVVITNKLTAGAPQFTTLLTNWDLSPKLKDSLFIFVPPKKAEKIDFLPAG